MWSFKGPVKSHNLVPKQDIKSGKERINQFPPEQLFCSDALNQLDCALLGGRKFIDAST